MNLYGQDYPLTYVNDLFNFSFAYGEVIDK